MELQAPIFISVLYIIIAIIVITVNGILAVKKQNPYAKYVFIDHSQYIRHYTMQLCMLYYYNVSFIS